MQKTKKQKYEQQIRRSIKTILNIQPQLVQYLKNLPFKNDTLINKTFPYVHGLRLLRILTLMEINYIIFAFLDIIEKTKQIKVQNVKIGIIGGGVMGRLILNTLLIFTKQGLKTQNITVSTRQPQHLQFYTQNFGIKTFFDNQKIAKQSDIIFVATPSTLDNWIIVDIKKHIQNKIHTNTPFQTNKTSYASTINIQNTEPINKIGSSVGTQVITNKKGQTQDIGVGKTSKKIIAPIKQDPINLSPFVYILTSDITQEKAKKIFNCPVMVPWIRATDIAKILQKLKTNISKKQFNQLLSNPQNIIKQLQSTISEQLTRQNSKTSNNQSQKPQMNFSRIDTLINTLSYCCKKLQNNWRKNIAFIKSKTDIQSNDTNRLYNQVLQSQGSYAQTFLTKSRKWRMAYNNFIA